MVEMVEAEVAGCAFVIELSDLNGAAQLPEGKKVSLIQY
jgi:adenine/guanine phosphoribosyltransferase-like PRPP-binding protein